MGDFTIWDVDDEADDISVLGARLNMWMRRQNASTVVQDVDGYSDINVTTHETRTTTGSQERFGNWTTQLDIALQ
ncbi:hypothetical protein D3C85_1447940 [compost metagenome]